MGIGYCLGFVLPPNFRAPLASIGFRDIWQRWHEEVSKPFEDSEQARQVKEALEQVGVVFPARDEPAEIV